MLCRGCCADGPGGYFTRCRLSEVETCCGVTLCALLFVTCELRARRHVRLEITIRNTGCWSLQSLHVSCYDIYFRLSARVTVAPPVRWIRAFRTGFNAVGFRAPAMAPARRAVGSGCLERARHRRSLPRRQYPNTGSQSTALAALVPRPDHSTPWHDRVDSVGAGRAASHGGVLGYSGGCTVYAVHGFGCHMSAGTASGRG